MSTEKSYVLGTHDAEAVRLGLQHRLWSDAAHAAWRRAGIKPDSKVLDVGCGPGFGTFDLAQIVTGMTGGGLVVAMDESERYVERVTQGAAARGHQGNVIAVRGDVQHVGAALGEAKDRLSPRGYTGGSFFDAAYARWVLCFVPDPEAVVRGVAASLKPAGRFVVHDYFNYESMTIAPRDKAFTRVIQAVGASWRARGGDPDVVARIPGFMHRCGMDVEVLDVHQRVCRPHEPMWAWPDTFFRGYIPTLVEYGNLTPEEGRAGLAAWDRACADPDGFMSVPPMYEVIGRKR